MQHSSRMTSIVTPRRTELSNANILSMIPSCFRGLTLTEGLAAAWTRELASASVSTVAIDVPDVRTRIVQRCQAEHKFYQLPFPPVNDLRASGPSERLVQPDVRIL